MSVARACQPCRSARARCNLARPSCGRCRRWGLTCYGYPSESTSSGYIFRSENEAVRRRSDRRSGRTSSSGSGNVSQRESVSTADILDTDLKDLFTWLSARAIAEVSTALKREPCTRAVEALFINWTLYPSNDGVSPGYLQNLPELYNATQDGSALWWAVRAVSAADKRYYHDGTIGWNVKAMTNYGQALARIREKATDERRMTEDCALAALMLIDEFEIMHLARAEPLGPHSSAVQQMLRLRGTGQFYDGAQYALWRVAHDRLLARQILFREGPSEEQLAWFENLDTSAPNLRICADKMRICVLCHEARQLAGLDSSHELSEMVMKVNELTNRIDEVLASVKTWSEELVITYRPAEVNAEDLAQSGDSRGGPLPRLTVPNGSSALAYRDVSMAYLWDFQAASQIVLRESLIEVLETVAARHGSAASSADVERVRSERATVEHLSENITRTLPQLLGLVLPKGGRGDQPMQGAMVGRFFVLFPMWVIQRARFTPEAHKDVAAEVVRWINETHGLG